MRGALCFVLLAACASAGSNRNVPGQDADTGRDGNGGSDDGNGGSDADIDAPPHIDAPGATGTHLVINEVDYDNVGTDSAEFVEILNPTGASINLSGIALMLVNGSTNTVYTNIDLSSAGSLGAGKYLVIAGASVTVPAGAVGFTPSNWVAQDNIQNGAPDGMALVDTAGPSVIDALSYEGSMTSVTLTGFAAKVSLVEGTATTQADNNTTAGSLCRVPDGADTDNASADWSYCTTLTPGAPNQ